MDWHRYDADPDPDPTFYFDVGPDPDPALNGQVDKIGPELNISSISIFSNEFVWYKQRIEPL